MSLTIEEEAQLSTPSFTECFIGHDPTEARVWEEYLVFGVFDRRTVDTEVQNARWQRERVRMLNSSLIFKWNVLAAYLRNNKYNRHSRVVVTNYVCAIKRGGLIK